MRSELFRLHSELEERHWWFRGRRTIMRSLIHRSVPRGSGATVIDVGCGTGANIAALAKDYRCIGLDPSANAVALARERYPSVRFIHGRAPADIADDAAGASMFLLMDVLEHVSDDFLLLSSLLAASSPGAHMLITVPADVSLWSEHDISFGHYRRYDRSRLAALWHGLPVTARLISHFNARLYPLVKIARTISARLGRASGIANTDLRLPPRPVNAMLEHIFAGEFRRLLQTLDTESPGYRRGVSLVALLRRESGRIEPRFRPPQVRADQHHPEAHT